MSTTTPKVSVIMPVYNAEKFLRESIDSVLRQSFTDFELLIINDGSADATQSIIDAYAGRDDRIVSIQQENQGLVATLNNGIQQARGTYIARIDGDDPWMDDKLEEQMAIITTNSTIVLVGGGFEIIDEEGAFIETIHTPTTDEDLRRAFYVRNPFGHSSVLFLKQAALAVGLYSNAVGPTEDYDLWMRLADQGKLAAIARPVFRYRINLNGISTQQSDQQTLHTKRTINSLWKDGHPSLVARSDITKKTHYYLNLPARKSYSIGIKRQYLSDIAQIGIKFIRHHAYLKGITQLFIVASTGRTGLHVVIDRFKKLDTGSLKQFTER